VSGSFQELGDVSRIRFKTIAVQSAGIAAQSSADVVNDSKVQRLLASSASGGNAPRIAQGTSGAAPAQSAPVPVQQSAQPAQTSQGSRQQPAPIVVERPAAPPVQAGPQSGTYTIYPRLRSNQGGVDKNFYLDRIVVRGGYLTMYFTGSALGRGGDGDYAPFWGSVLLRDLDRPSRTWNSVAKGEDDDVTGGIYLTFQGVTATRFSLTGLNATPNHVFDEIIMGLPD
jgi:hypothetical protein